MRYIIILFITVFGLNLSHSQIHEVGLFLGGSNFVGDVGATDYISPNQLAIGGVYKWNQSPRYSWRASIIFTELEGIDNKSDDPRRIKRGFEFKTDMIEISAGMEFTFFDFDLHSGKKLTTPYLFGGISVAHHDDYYFLNGMQANSNTSSWDFGIPMALGIKSTFLDNFILSLEVGLRYTFSDNIDGSLPEDAALKQYKFGNINNNDWYVFTGVTITYTFGFKPCYCGME